MYWPPVPSLLYLLPPFPSQEVLHHVWQMRDFSVNPHKLYPGFLILWSWVLTILTGSHTLSYPVHKQELDGGSPGNQLSRIWIASQRLTLIEANNSYQTLFGWWLLPFLATEEVRDSHIARSGKEASCALHSQQTAVFFHIWEAVRKE